MEVISVIYLHILIPIIGVPEAVNVIQATIAVVAALVSAPINIYIFIIILKYKELHQKSLLLSLQIIAIEILYYLTVPITILISTINGTWVLGDILCDITGMIHDAFAMLRFTMTLVLTTDRFLSVYQPFFYFKNGGKVSWSLSGRAWAATVVRVVLPLTGVLGCYVYIPTFKTCTAYPGCSKQCEIFAAWSIGLIIFTGVVMPLVLYAAMFYIIRKITRYHSAVQVTTVTQTKSEEAKATENFKKYSNILSTRKRFVTVSILLISIVGTMPAFTLYMASIFYSKVNLVLFIVNMLIGRTSFNLIPLFDVIAISRHRDIKKVLFIVYQFVKSKIIRDDTAVRGSHVQGNHRGTLGPRKSLTSISTL